MLRLNKIARAVTLVLGGSTVLLTPIEAMAQDSQRVEITGSMIRRISGEAALPVTILSVDELQKGGRDERRASG